jgi:hypothetical protein
LASLLIFLVLPKREATVAAETAAALSAKLGRFPAFHRLNDPRALPLIAHKIFSSHKSEFGALGLVVLLQLEFLLDCQGARLAGYAQDGKALT